MKSFAKIFFLVLITIVLTTKSDARDVTNEELHGGLLSLVRSYQLMDDKLERHEFRERHLGEKIKKGLQILHDGQKSCEAMKGMFTRLDERVSQIETMLISQEEKYNTQSDKVAVALEDVLKWMKENNGGGCDTNNVMAALTATPPPTNINAEMDAAVLAKVDELNANIKDLERTNRKLLEQTEYLLRERNVIADEVITKLDDKLTNFSYRNREPVVMTTSAPQILSRNSDFEDSVTSLLSQLTDNVNNIKPVLVEKSPNNHQLSNDDKNFLHVLANETLKKIENLRFDLIQASDKTFALTSDLKLANDKVQKDTLSVLSAVTDSNARSDTIIADVKQTFSVLQNDLVALEKLDRMITNTSDNIMETQRKVDYGVLHVLVKMGDLIRLQNSEMNATLQKRFDEIDMAIINNHIEGLQNLSSTMELEISHVWRQIEIMHSEITYSKDALNKLLGQTDSYVNGTANTMDSMEGKVSQITTRMLEVDSNLNYLLGRLSLVTQEFNQIKLGLGEAFNEIRGTFQSVEDNIKTVGPGPHKIPTKDCPCCPKD